jgi:predicted TPR repeat methyltransferase
MPRPGKPSKRKPSRGWVPGAVDRAMRQQQQGAIAEAMAGYRHVLASEPDHVDALHFLGVAEHQQGNSEVARELMTRAAELAPDYPDVHVNLARVLRRLGRLDEAEARLRRALALRPDDAMAAAQLGMLLSARGRHEEAVASLGAAAGRGPAQADVAHALGTSLEALGRFDEAIDALRSAHALRPGTESSFRHLGAMLYARGRVTDAAGVYRAWLELDPECSEAKHLLVACSGERAPERAPDEFVRGLFDRFASSFDDSLARLQYRAPALVIEASRAALGPPGAALDVLDAGCGTGLCGADLRPYARRLVGVDLSAGMLDRAREKGAYDALVEAELTRYLEESPAAYDLIVSADTFVYFGALEALVGAMARALRPGGHAVFTTERSEEADASDGHRLHPHGRYSHTEGYVRRALSATGLADVSARAVDLRMEAGQRVHGWLFTAHRP